MRLFYFEVKYGKYVIDAVSFTSKKESCIWTRERKKIVKQKKNVRSSFRPINFGLFIMWTSNLVWWEYKKKKKKKAYSPWIQRSRSGPHPHSPFYFIFIFRLSGKQTDATLSIDETSAPQDTCRSKRGLSLNYHVVSVLIYHFHALVDYVEKEKKIISSLEKKKKKEKRIK